MERFFAASQDSPLQMLRMLEGNLKRERRIFAIAVGLLIFAAVCGAIAATVFMLTSTLKTEQEIVQSAMRTVNVVVFSRYNILTPGSLLLEVGAVAPKSAALQSKPKPLCEAFPADREATALATACAAARATIPEESTRPVLQYASFDGSASYGYGFFDDIDEKLPAATRLVALTDTAKTFMKAHGIAPLDAAHARRVMWFIAPQTIGFFQPTVIMFMVVARDNAPFALVFTRIDLNWLIKRVTPESLESQFAIFDEGGALLAGDDTDYTRYANPRLAEERAAVYHWLPVGGWGARFEPLALGMGHIVVALPLATELAAKRSQAIIMVLVTGALVAMLLAMYRYWNFRFLTRTYEQACRAVEGEILNHLLVHATPVGLCIALRDSFQVIAANQIARTLFDLNDASMVLPAGLSNTLAARGIAREEGDEAMIRQVQYSLEKPDDGTLHLKVSYAGAVVNQTDVLFCAIVDITEHHEVERLLRLAKDDSDAAAKAKLGFFASMSHEIRTPLSSLVGNLELVALGPLAPEQQARVHAMQASAGALLQVVNDVLDFSKMDVGEMRLAEEWGSIRELVLRAMVAHAPLANRQGLKLYVVLDRSCPARVSFDPIRVSQILNNLLGNALKFTHSGKVVVRAAWTDNALRLSVADSGIGIPKAQREKLFRPFIQGEAHRLTQARGTGLGLSICVRLCELMKGRISLDSAEGVGTRIDVSLPLAVDESASGAGLAMPDGKPAILCRASEYREWFENLYDADRSSLTFVGPTDTALAQGCDYLIFTDEFSEQVVQTLWKQPARVIRMTQDGPLVPVHWADGVLEVSIFSLQGIRDAIAIVEDRKSAPGRAASAGALDVAAARVTGPVVVIAEDNRLNRGLLRDQLLTLGAVVLEAHDGEEALDLLRKHRVDIVLTDMDMPKMSGGELLIAARELDPAMPIYAISASASAQDVERGRAQGFTDYLTKPVPLAVLAGVLQAPAAARTRAQADAKADAKLDARVDARVDAETDAQRDDEDDDLPPRFPPVPSAYTRDFVAQVDEDIVALAAICKSRDAQKLRRWAHKLAGGLTVLGPSMLYDQCQELRAVLRESGSWVEEVDTFTVLIRDDLVELRDALHAALQAPQK
ncbi:hybrid sensor histidine kinase/response regulator [Caballeronia sp. Lep1P3]|uniref:hybrid sensor histidine kinase/response regulator n=1 Tax=Caballeronia sp. Lep1P3 TaxID=2878150 RepID=UPI001FD07DE1|nr:hybrid sensor histidine kinase/response regulator [Caballeronia sp. Lep1P3]